MSPLFLQVSFKDKERAKALGARWDFVHKKWYIPENTCLEPFSEWLPSSSETHPFQILAEDRGISLSQLLSRVSQAITQALPRSEWIRAEVSECHLKTGHFYLDLVEFDTNQQLLCKAKGIIFKSRLPPLSAKFQLATGSFLKAGMKVLLQVKANFSVQYGFSLSVEDIDPNYTLGDMAAKLAHIREQLQKEGIYTQNKQCPSPQDFTRIVVISPEKAAGLGDFQEGALRLERLDLCYFHYYTAQFQGVEASGQIASAIKAVIQEHKKRSFDALVILRGGGAVIDLAWLNDYSLAKQICDCPFVVFTGIGHERDNTILDEVAFLRFDTPSKVIAYVFNRIVDNAQIAMRHAAEIKARSEGLCFQIQHAIFEQLTGITRKAEQEIHAVDRLIRQWYHHSLDQAKNSLTLMTANLKHAFDRLHENGHFSVQALRDLLWQYWQDVHTSWPSQLREAEQEVLLCWQQLKGETNERQGLAEQHLKELVNGLYREPFKIHLQVENSLAELMENIMGLGPAATLQRGYALVRNPLENKVMTSKARSEIQSQLEIEFHDGYLKVKPI